MRRIGLVIVVIGTMVTFAFAQKAEIDVVNAKWTDLFNKGDFAGLAVLYTDDATAFLPGAEISRGAAEISRVWKGIGCRRESGWNLDDAISECMKLSSQAARSIG